MRALEGLDGVQSVEMQYKEKKCTVVRTPNRASQDDLLATVRSIGDEAGNNFTPSIEAQSGG